jgi:hypothetical protein
MKGNFSLLLIIVVASHFGIIQVFAQKQLKPREVIVIEFTSPRGSPAKYEVLINRTPKTNYEILGGGAYAGGVGCGDCSREEYERLKEKHKAELASLSYGFSAKAWRMGKNKSNLNFGISTGGNCRTQKTFTVYRDRQTKIQLDCGVTLTAYYGLESKEAN